jgi:MinD-like ATPase involved in chromosome partitioning or flagellar assembly
MSLLNRSALATPPGVRSQVDALRTRGARSDRRRGDAGVPTLLCASGRGGSGTTVLAALLAVAAAGDGYRVLLVDADDHVGPLSMMLQAPVTTSWQDLRGGRVSPEEVATPLSATLTLVAGGPARRTAPDAVLPITSAERRACLRRVHALAQGMDLVVVDCGSRFDTLAAAVIPHADERVVAVASGADPIALASTYALCKAVQTRHVGLPVDVLLNRHDEATALRCFDVIDAGARQFLGTTLQYAGSVPADVTLDAVPRAGQSFAEAVAGSPAALAAHAIVMRTLDAAIFTRPGA